MKSRPRSGRRRARAAGLPSRWRSCRNSTGRARLSGGMSMSEQVTGRHALPLLQPAQAQKHVTVNESLLRLDGLVNLVLQGTARVQSPAVVEGECWGVGAGATGAWEGQAGRIAIGANGGWVFATPQRGQRAFLLDRGAEAVWDGQEWRGGALTLGLW